MIAEPIRGIVLRDVEVETGAALAEADRAAAAELARAAEEAAAIVERARRDGATAAELEWMHERALARRQSQRLVLEARRAVYDAFRREAHEAALRVREGDRYPALLERLAQAAREQLGEEAALEIDPPGLGGVRGHMDGREVDYTLPALADRCIESLAGEIEQLWR